MSATTPRTISNAPDLRQLLIAVGALILAVALLVAVTVSQRMSFQATSAPAAVSMSAPDHGWSSAPGAQDVSRTGPGGLVFTGIPYIGNAAGDLVVRTANGGIRYTGIPYPAPETDRQGGSNGTRFAQ
jgi:hypothetical protein